MRVLVRPMPRDEAKPKNDRWTRPTTSITTVALVALVAFRSCESSVTRNVIQRLIRCSRLINHFFNGLDGSVLHFGRRFTNRWRISLRRRINGFLNR